MEEQYWWLRFGNYSPGLFNLPHMGEVIADYRRRRYQTQELFAIAVDDKTRNVQEWETHAMIADIERRIFLAKLLQIPPALLGLTWHQVYSEDSPGNYYRSLERLSEAAEEDAYYVYEDILTVSYECLHRGGAQQLAYRLNRRITHLKNLIPLVPEQDREAWQTLLVRFYFLYGAVIRHRIASTDQAVGYFREALDLAKQLDDNQLICHAYQSLANGYECQGNLPAANEAIQAAMERIKDMHTAITPLKGTIYLRAISIQGRLAGSSQTEQNAARKLADKAAAMLYRGNVDDDGTFFTFNLAAVNHEKAKLLLQFAQQRRGEGYAIAEREADAIQARLQAALKAVPADLTVWKMYFHLTEARMYLAQHDVEASAHAGKEGLKAARTAGSLEGISQIKVLYTALKEKDPKSVYVDNLGVALGLY